MSYDEMVRKTFVIVFSILVFFILGYFSFPKIYAVDMTVDKLPPCAQWADPNGNSINAQDAANRINAANKLLASPKDKQDGNVKCATVITAIGPMDTNPAKFVQRIFSMVLGLAGGIALILIIIAGYKFMASQGNPEAVKSATEGLTSAVIGLLFIIFSFVILQIIGVDILRIPGFSK